MIDIINYQIYGFPVLMYGMMAITAGGLTYATVSASGNLASTPGAAPADPALAPASVAPASVAPASVAPASVAPASAAPSPVIGGKRKSAKSSPKRKHSGTAKKHA